MNATVKFINPKKGMCAAETERGEYVVFELLGSNHPALGDVLSHPDFYALGSAEYRNTTRKATLSVYVQNVVGSLTQAKRQCFL